MKGSDDDDNDDIYSGDSDHDHDDNLTVPTGGGGRGHGSTSGIASSSTMASRRYTRASSSSSSQQYLPSTSQQVPPLSSSSRSKNRRIRRREGGNLPVCSPTFIPYTCAIVFVVVTLQFIINSVLYNKNNRNDSNLFTVSSNDNNDSNRPPGLTMISSLTAGVGNQRRRRQQQQFNSTTTTSSSSFQRQIVDIKRRIENLESKSNIYVEGYNDQNEFVGKFFPFVIRDSRHLVPTQTSSEFHIFDYVDITSAKQTRAKNSQLFHNANLLFDAPCQKYTISCYRSKIIQVFEYVLTNFPTVEYYFYVEADNDLCVPMSQVRDLALTERRYFINTGIGFSGWIMSREFMTEFLELYKKVSSKSNPNPVQEELRPDVIASYFLTDKHAWSVTRQYWVSHTTIESVGAPSLTVKDRRNDVTGKRFKLDKHLPRCLEPRRGKWKRHKRPLDPRDKFGWDYFDYEVCPQSLIFPCGGPNQLAELVAEDLKIANATGALKFEERLAKDSAAVAAAEANKRQQKNVIEGSPKRHLYHPGGGVSRQKRWQVEAADGNRPRQDSALAEWRERHNPKFNKKKQEETKEQSLEPQKDKASINDIEVGKVKRKVLVQNQSPRHER